MRWMINSLVLWAVLRYFSPGYLESPGDAGVFVLAGFVLSMVNSVLKPIVVVLALPAILLTLGLFMLVVNGLMVYITFKVVPGLDIDFLGAIVVGVVVSIANWLMSGIIDSTVHSKQERI